MRGNGERIGPQNIPTSSVAGGIWNLLNQQRAQQRGAWPSATPAVVTDPYFMYVPLLLNTTSTNGQQNNTFLDSSTNNFTITRNGTPTQGAFTPYQPSGYWSGYFNGSSDYLTIPYNTSLNFTADFTVEFWVNPTSKLTLYPCIINNYSAYTTNGGFAIFAGHNSGNTAKYNVAFNGSFPVIQSTTNISYGSWQHIALVRSGSTLTLYVDGVANGTSTQTATVAGTANNWWIGTAGDNVTNSYFNGYISNLRVVKGVAVYTGAFTPPAAPLAATQSAGTNISAITGTQCSLLICSSNRFIDIGGQVTPNVITVNGTPKVQAFQPFAPTASYSAATYGGSGLFNGSTDYLTALAQTGLSFAGDFTIEMWVYPTSAPSGNYGLIDARASSGTLAAWCWNLYSTSGTKLDFIYGSARVTSASTVPINQWVHLAVSRSGSTIRQFINGVLDANTASYSSAINANRANIYIGNLLDASTTLPGYISNFRVVNGTAIYTGAFTPPTLPVTAVSGTSLLTNFTNAGIYDAAWQNDVTTVGDAQVSTTIAAKWPPTSMKFDGTGDWLTAIDGTQLQLGTGDFTIEGWVYLSANGVIYGILSKGTAITGWSVNVTVLNKLQFSYTASNLTGATSLSASTWYYFAVVRSGTATGNLKVYLNGTVDATSGGAVTDNFNQTNTLYVGADRIGTSPLNGYLQDVRITKYARTITTPTAAFPTR